MSEASDQPTAEEELAERRTSAVELLWDLVFVFAVTQVTALLAHDPGWDRFGESMLLLALVWWAWSAFVWAANAEADDSRVLRSYLLTGTVLVFVVGLSLPQAFTHQGALFAVAYTLVRLLHLALYTDASRRGHASARAIAGFAVTVAIGMALLVVGGVALHGWHRALLWAFAAAIDYAGPAWLTRERLRGLQRVAVAHFSERYGSFVIICLGESVIAIGVGVGRAGHPLTAGLVVAAALALLPAIGMWWTYFDRIAEVAAQRLRQHADPVLAAADAYSYIHLMIVAGIIIYAGGVRLVVHNSVSAPMPSAGRLALCGGVALYLFGLAAFRLRITGERTPGKVVAAIALLALFAAGGSIAAWVIAAGIAAIVGALCVAEAIAPGDRTEHTGQESRSGVTGPQLE